jgi:hypothetical protein
MYDKKDIKKNEKEFNLCLPDVFHHLYGSGVRVFITSVELLKEFEGGKDPADAVPPASFRYNHGTIHVAVKTATSERSELVQLFGTANPIAFFGSIFEAFELIVKQLPTVRFSKTAVGSANVSIGARTAGELLGAFSGDLPPALAAASTEVSSVWLRPDSVSTKNVKMSDNESDNVKQKGKYAGSMNSVAVLNVVDADKALTKMKAEPTKIHLASALFATASHLSEQVTSAVMHFGNLTNTTLHAMRKVAIKEVIKVVGVLKEIEEACENVEDEEIAEEPEANVEEFDSFLQTVVAEAAEQSSKLKRAASDAFAEEERTSTETVLLVNTAAEADMQTQSPPTDMPATDLPTMSTAAPPPMQLTFPPLLEEPPDAGAIRKTTAKDLAEQLSGYTLKSIQHGDDIDSTVSQCTISDFNAFVIAYNALFQLLLYENATSSATGQHNFLHARVTQKETASKTAHAVFALPEIQPGLNWQLNDFVSGRLRLELLTLIPIVLLGLAGHTMPRLHEDRMTVDRKTGGYTAIPKNIHSAMITGAAGMYFTITQLYNGNESEPFFTQQIEKVTQMMTAKALLTTGQKRWSPALQALALMYLYADTLTLQLDSHPNHTEVRLLLDEQRRLDAEMHHLPLLGHSTKRQKRTAAAKSQNSRKEPSAVSHSRMQKFYTSVQTEVTTLFASRRKTGVFLLWSSDEFQLSIANQRF